MLGAYAIIFSSIWSVKCEQIPNFALVDRYHKLANSSLSREGMDYKIKSCSLLIINQQFIGLIMIINSNIFIVSKDFFLEYLLYDSIADIHTDLFQQKYSYGNEFNFPRYFNISIISIILLLKVVSFIFYNINKPSSALLTCSELHTLINLIIKLWSYSQRAAKIF